MNNIEEIKIKKELHKKIAIVLATMINETYGEKADPETAQLIKQKDNEADELEDLLEMSLTKSSRKQFSYFLHFHNQEVKLPFGTDFIMYYKDFLIEGKIFTSIIDLSKLKYLKSVIESFK
jgi:K+/H+ antiporter YhaU regulatory subunit KhtT